jgi:predicted DNA-binding protein
MLLFIWVIYMKDTLQRTTIFLTKNQHEKLRLLAFQRRKSMAQLIREAALDILEDEEDLKSALTIMDNDEEMVEFEDYNNKRKKDR